ncbi:MAG TPA: DUF2917 domain-containing protein [Burkholderiales bacterium]|nr:DUF2917 domain-containing protein [Burkholderiales bacterium]
MERRLWTEPFDARVVATGVRLEGAEVVGIRNARGALVFVESGTAWITQENDVRDVIVSAGEWFRLDCAGVALMQAHRSATITITAPDDGAEREVFRPAPPRARRTGHPFVRRFWAIWLRLYRRHARPGAWEMGLQLKWPSAPGRPGGTMLDPLGPHRVAARDPIAELRAAVTLETSRAG